MAAVAGCLLGTAVGDALGLPAEGMSRARRRALFGEIEGHRLLFGRGLVSDDTEHAILVAQALVASAGDSERFANALAHGLRRWFLLLPAGIGFATLRACLRLLVGFPPDRSGIRSAGNGPAMRAPLIGVCFGADGGRLQDLVRASTRITHTDRRAEYGALAVALAAHHAASSGTSDGERYLAALRDLLPDNPDALEMVRLAEAAAESAAAGEETTTFAARVLDDPEHVSGYIYRTVPAALHAWLRHPNDYRAAIRGVIACGGDADTTAAIAGGILGAAVGEAGIPTEWSAGLIEWPCSVRWMQRLAYQVASVIAPGRSEPPLRAPLAAVAARNLLFVAVVIYHGLRRLLPPYAARPQ